MTGKMGLVRNLTAGEILGQVFFARETVKRHGMVSISFESCDAIRSIEEDYIGKLAGRMVAGSASCQD